MSRYIKKHKWQVAGVALPLFFLFFLGAVSLSVFPGWLKLSYGVIGAPCQNLAACAGAPPNQCDSTQASLLLACDQCAGEVCSFISSGSFCTQGTAPLPTCPNTGVPECYGQCFTTLEQLSATIFGATAACGPSDSLCQGLSGGTQANDCRIGVCLPGATTFDIGNPTGCDYDYSGGVDCINCAPPTDQTVNCGNGVCEPGIGEDFDSCSVDCRAPDFDSPAPIPEDPDPSNPNPSYPLNEACRQPIASISFSGNLPGGGTCEDGDVCTTNVCTFVGPNLIPFCDVEPAGCNDTEIDFCCPDGCTPSDDLDCLPPEVCEPTPSPTPSASPLLLFGSGCSLHRAERLSE